MLLQNRSLTFQTEHEIQQPKEHHNRSICLSNSIIKRAISKVRKKRSEMKSVYLKKGIGKRKWSLKETKRAEKRIDWMLPPVTVGYKEVDRLNASGGRSWLIKEKLRVQNGFMDGGDVTEITRRFKFRCIFVGEVADKKKHNARWASKNCSRDWTKRLGSIWNCNKSPVQISLCREPNRKKKREGPG